MPLLKNMTFLCTEKWESDQSVLQITKMPVLFLSGCSDELIPQIHMKTLFELCASKRSDAVVQRGMTGKHGLYWKEFPKGKHNDTCGQEGYMRAIQKFYHAHF